MERVGGRRTSVGICRGHRVVAGGGDEQSVVMVVPSPGVCVVVRGGGQGVGITIADSVASSYHRLRRFVHYNLGCGVAFTSVGVGHMHCVGCLSYSAGDYRRVATVHSVAPHIV